MAQPLGQVGMRPESSPTLNKRTITKREALAWGREQLHKVEADLDMTFESFIDTYTADMKNRLKENTWHTKEHIIRTKLLPYFAKRKMNTIQLILSTRPFHGTLPRKL